MPGTLDATPVFAAGFHVVADCGCKDRAYQIARHEPFSVPFLGEKGWFLRAQMLPETSQKR